MNAFEEMNRRIEPEKLEQAGIIERAKTRANGYPTYICPVCGNGSGRTGDGLTVRLNNRGFWKFHCFGECGGKDYSVADILAAYCGVDGETKEGRRQIVKIAEEKFGISDNNFSFHVKQKSLPENPNVKQNSELKNLASKHKSAQAKIASFVENHGGKYRGVSTETYQIAGVGYSEEFGGKIIFPYDDYHDTERLINVPTDGKGKYYVNGEGGGVYRIQTVKEDSLNFIVEGEFDALSIAESLGDITGIVATGGNRGIGKIISQLDERFKYSRRKPKFIILPDNDNAGEAEGKKLLAILNAAGYPAVSYILSSKYKDANEFLQADRQKFIKRLIDIIDTAVDDLKEVERVQAEQDFGIAAGLYFTNYFDEDIAQSKKFTDRKTGFENIDEKQIFSPGLYVLGGLPSAGKTAFAWQLLEQVTERGETAVYLSYEMSRLELFTRLLSRKLFIEHGEKISSAEIRGGKITENLSHARALQSSSNIDLRVLELKNETVTEILERLKRFCDSQDKPPIICLDYLQILPTGDKEKRLGIDDIVRELKNFQRETNTTFIVISSFNRQNYYQPVGFESFKESGGIEYSGDVVWGLQFAAMTTLGDNEKTGEIRAKIEQAKKEEPRRMHLSCLKNRQGALYDVYFEYFAMCDCFVPCEEKKQFAKIK